jgi:hypothetical protein
MIGESWRRINTNLVKSESKGGTDPVKTGAKSVETGGFWSENEADLVILARKLTNFR